MSGGTVDILVNNAGMYYPMSLDEGPNKGQGPLDGVFGASSLDICQCILFLLHTVGNVCCSRSFSMHWGSNALSMPCLYSDAEGSSSKFEFLTGSPDDWDKQTQVYRLSTFLCHMPDWRYRFLHWPGHFTPMHN